MRTTVTGVAALLATLLVACAPGGESCPTLEQFQAYSPPEATKVFAVDGSLLADLSPERRTVVELRDVPASVRDGFVAVEDRRFWQHDGVDYRGVVRAVVANVRSLSFAEGFSTITMQLTRNVFPDELPRGEKLRRKVCEIRLAGQIEDAIDKPEILKRYINQVYMGDGRYGVEEAARGYFGKPARDLELPEAALLVGLVKNPEGYNPRRNRLRAIQRRNTVLEVMAREDIITADQATAAKAAPLRVAPPLEAAGAAPWFVAEIREQLRVRFGSDADVQGLRVYTGLDPAIQRATRDALVNQIRRIESGELGRYTHPVADSALPVATGNGSPFLQGMALVLDNRTGIVRAFVGGRDFRHSGFDRAFDARRQPGSAFKPIVYAAALQQGLTASTRISTTPVSITGATGPVWRPDDLVNDSVESLRVRDALALSSNNAAVRIGQFVGEQRVIETARALGLSTPIPAYPSIFLGAAEVIPAEFIAAYATLANGGYRVRPTFITRVEDGHGRVLWESDSRPQPVLDAGVAFLTVDIMRDVVDHGTAGVIRRAGFHLPAAGKTGTTNDARDLWFVGMTPELTAGVWLGFDQPREVSPNASGGRFAAPVWAEIMKVAHASDSDLPGWSPPTNVIAVSVDTASGFPAAADCPPGNVRVEYFLQGTQPLRFCPLHSGGRSLVDRLVQGLRRIF